MHGTVGFTKHTPDWMLPKTERVHSVIHSQLGVWNLVTSPHNGTRSAGPKTKRSAFARSYIASSAFGIWSLRRATPHDQQDPKPNGKYADMTKPVQGFIRMCQSNMVGMGKVTGSDTSLENAVNMKNKYPYVVAETHARSAHQDVRFILYRSSRGPMNEELMTVTQRTIGP